MKVSLSWLREFVPIELDPPALCERLTLGGLAVDGVEELGAEIAASWSARSSAPRRIRRPSG